MKKAINYIGILAVAVSIISCGGDQNSQAQAAPGGQIAPYPVIEVPTRTVTGYESYPANIEGVVNSEVNAKVSGYITEVLVDEGQEVRKGQTLFKLETQSLDQDAEAAKANVNAAQVEVNKLKPLVEKNIISEVQLETAKAELQQAKSNYNSIIENIGYANIKSPVNGYVGSINLREGALVSPNRDTPLTTVSDISKVYAYFSMNETDYLNFIQDKSGKTVQEKIDAMPKVQLKLANNTIYDHEGTIQLINSQINANTGAISFRAIFENPERILTNGNSGEIRIPQTYEDAVVIPQISTYERQGNVLVYKLLGQDSVAVSTIKIKAPVDNLYVIESGIKSGDTIVATGISKVSSGVRIKPQPVPFDSIAKPIDKVFQ